MPGLQHCGAGSPLLVLAVQVLKVGWGLQVYLQPRERVCHQYKFTALKTTSCSLITADSHQLFSVNVIYF